MAQVLSPPIQNWSGAGGGGGGFGHLLCTFLGRLTRRRKTVNFRGDTNRVFGKRCFGPLPKRGRFDENGENDEVAFYPLKTRASLLKRPKMTKMADVTQEKAWFRKSRVCPSLKFGDGGLEPEIDY